MPPNRSPRRPVLRLRNVLLMCIALVAAWVGLEVYRALTAVPGAAIDYGAHVAELTERYQPPGGGPGTPNAWDALLDAIARADEVEAVYRGPVLPEEGATGAIVDYTLIYAPTNDDDPYRPYTAAIVRAKSARALEAMEEAGIFEAIAEAARRPRAVRPRPHGRLIDTLLPELGRARNLARASAARMFLAAQDGDHATVATAFEGMMALGRVLSHQFTLIDHLVGIAIQSLAMREARQLLIEHRFDEHALAAMLAALERQPLAPFDVAMEGERIGMLDIVQWTHTDDGRGSGRLIVSEVIAIGATPGAVPFGSTPLVNLGGLFFASKAATTRKLEEIIDAQVRRAHAPPSRRALVSPNPDLIMESLTRRYLLLRLVLPAWNSAIESRDHADTELAGTRVMLAIELFRARHGRLPEALTELVPEILPKMPLDPTTGAPFAYRVFQDGEDEHGRGYLLYSWGGDGVDNGGLRHPKENVFARGSGAPGYDFIINDPRPEPKPAEPDPYAPDPADEEDEEPGPPDPADEAPEADDPGLPAKEPAEPVED